jgi:hypothetical protein
LTVNESVEMLMKIRLEGQAELDKLAASVRGVSGATTVASEGFASLEKSLAALTTAVNANTASLEGLEGGFNQAAGGARRLGEESRRAVTDVQAASAAIRGLDGSMNIRAAERFISLIGGIGPLLQAAFPVFGALALFNVFEQIYDKVDQWYDKYVALKDVNEEIARTAKAMADDFERSAAAFGRYQIDSLRRQGKPTTDLEVQQALSTPVKFPQPNKEKLEALRPGQMSSLQDLFGESTTGDLSTRARAIRDRLHVLELDLEDIGTGAVGTGPLTGADTKQLTAEQTMLQGLQQLVEQRQKESGAQVQDIRGRADADAKKKADEEALKRQRELEQAEKQAHDYLLSAQQFELTGIAKIDAEYERRLELLGKTDKARAEINQAHDIEVERYTRNQNMANAAKLSQFGAWWMEHGTLDPGTGGFSMDLKSPKSLQLSGYSEEQEKQDRKDIAAGLRVLMAGDDTDADSVRRSLGVTTRNSDPASNYSARVGAAREIFDIETRHLYLIDEQDKRDEAYANARKKRDEEIYRAAEQYENDLQSLRQRDLEQYSQFAGGIFDAARARNMNQWGRDFALGQVRQVFTNATAPIFQQVGHVLGGVTGGFNPGGILSGTIFDPANKGVNDSATTAKQTTRTADEVQALRGDLRAMAGAPGANSGAAMSTSDLANLPMTHDPIALAAQLAGWTGTGSGFGGAGSGGGSTFSQFFSGLGLLGSNPLEAVFTGQAHGDGWGANLTGAQRAGATFGLASMLAGAGLGIYSGISQGGVGGYTKAASSGLGAAAMLDPDPLSKSILGGVAALTGIIGSLFSTGPQQRLKDITNALSSNQYLAPTALNVTQGMNGTYEDFDARGNLRMSNFSAVPTVAEPYITSRVVDGQRTYYDAPGSVRTPYSGGPTGTGQAPVPNVTVNLNSIDSQSGAEFLLNNRHVIGAAVTQHLQTPDGEQLASQMRYHTNGQ